MSRVLGIYIQQVQDKKGEPHAQSLRVMHLRGSPQQYTFPYELYNHTNHHSYDQEH